MRRPRQLRQNLFLHFAEPRLWLKLLQLTVKVRSFEGRPHGAPLQRSGEYDIFLKVVRLPSDQRWTIRNQVMSSCRLNVRIPLTVEPAAQDISPASHAPLPWRCGEPKADAGAKGSHVAADAARKNPLRKHAAPASERRSAVCKAQSLSSSLSQDTSPSSVAAVCTGQPLIHIITAPHQRLPCVEDIFLIHMITAPHQRLPCVEDIF